MRKRDVLLNVLTVVAVLGIGVFSIYAVFKGALP